MNEIEILIRSMNKDGKTPRAIATELYERGLKNNLGNFLNPEMIEGFLRQVGAEPAKPPAVLHDKKKVPGEATHGATPSISPYSKDVPAIVEKPYRADVLRAWALGINYGDENSYPDAPPYNYTDKPIYSGGSLRGASSAAFAEMGDF